MIASPAMRWRAALIAVAGMAALSKSGWSETAPAAPSGTGGEQWQTTDRTMLDFVEDGYDLVSVVPSSSQARIYFLSKPGKIVKCREDVSPTGPPPVPPPLPGQAGRPPGQPGVFIPENFVPSVRVEFECAELARAPIPKH
jgi:hypothetical protein